VGGIATETVTEDAHTAMKLHALGWRSAYVAIPLAAGLATERFGYHVTQRVRWARGMLQILRLDNPLLKKGLSFPQRLNYLSATGHFLFGIPRLVYLVAPPAYLLLGLHPLQASAAAVAAYALPHVFLSIVGGSAFAQGARHSFQAEVYETAIAPFVALVTLLTLASPRHARFRVTVKGAKTDRTRFDARNALPNLVVAAFVAMAMLAVPWRWATWPTERATVLLAACWNLYNLVILAPALAVALDRPQRRSAWRVARSNRVELRAADGAAWSGRLLDLGEEGFAAWGPGEALPSGEISGTIESDRGAPLEVRGAVIARSEALGSGGIRVKLAGGEHRDAMLREAVEPANAWLPRPVPLDRPLEAFLGLVRVSTRALAERRRA
jgi:cellulose synthase (UDP-forming)